VDLVHFILNHLILALCLVIAKESVRVVRRLARLDLLLVVDDGLRITLLLILVIRLRFKSRRALDPILKFSRVIWFILMLTRSRCPPVLSHNKIIPLVTLVVLRSLITSNGLQRLGHLKRIDFWALSC
jgi:hypothetical protein